MKVALIAELLAEEPIGQPGEEADPERGPDGRPETGHGPDVGLEKGQEAGGKQQSRQAPNLEASQDQRSGPEGQGGDDPAATQPADARSVSPQSTKISISVSSSWTSTIFP